MGRDANWEALKAYFTDEQLDEIRKTWSRAPQTPEEVRAGVLAERARRDEATDKPGGTTDKIRQAIAQRTSPSPKEPTR